MDGDEWISGAMALGTKRRQSRKQPYPPPLGVHLMKNKRFLAAGTALALLGLMGTAGLADAQAAGVGTSKASTTILNVDLGDALKLRVGGDDAQSSTDPQIGPAGAFSRLVGLEASSAMLPALNVKIPDPAIESRTPGGAPESTLAGIDLTSGI